MNTPVAELEGNALIWAVCSALGQPPVISGSRVFYRSESGSWVEPLYIEDVAAVKLMTDDWIGVDRPSNGQTPPVWTAITNSKKPADSRELTTGVVIAHAETLGTAVCRALVLSRHGTEIDIPEQF